LVDGKWYDIKDDQFTSIPEAYDIFKEYPNVEVITAVNRHEWQNRNLYLERCAKDDFLIWIDTDEWLEVTNSSYESDLFAAHMSNIPMMSIPFEGKAHGAGTYQQNRIVIFPAKTMHRDRHNELWYNGTQIIQGKLPRIHGLLVHHDKSYRSEEREKAMFIRNRLRPFR
jgi:hypothetical protein